MLMINKAILMGRLTRDPELRHTGSGTPVCSFTVAIDNGYGDNRSTDFINCVAWNKTAEFVDKYFTKGRMIIVIGRIQTRSWDGQDGRKNYATEVVASEVSFGETKKNAEEYGRTQQSSSGYTVDPPAMDNFPDMPAPEDKGDDFVALDTNDDLPF